MSQGKVSKYLFYAIGEILLVVIGILIAVAINEWNESKKNDLKIRNNAAMLIEGLVSDSLDMVELQRDIERDKAMLDNFQERLTHHEATIDTLIKIARDEFYPGVNVMDFNNASAYETMAASGEINLFDKELLEEIYELYETQKRNNQSANDSFDTYVDASRDFRNRYTFDVPANILPNGPLFKKLWSNVNHEDLIGRFGNMASGKRLVYQQQGRHMDRVAQRINELLPKLRSLVAND